MAFCKIMSILAVVTALVTGLTAAPGTDAWQVDLAHPVSSSDISLAGDSATHISVYQPRVLDHPANTFTSSGGTADIRGQWPDGGWTEWTETPAVLPVLTRVVQVRVVGDALPGSLTIHPSAGPVASGSRAAEFGTEVFATREGLVGGHTASGHVIADRDHFVALPSRRGLSTKESGDYTVKVCARNGRCEWAPVWDIGPWNTKDDYWNPAGTRQMWPDLPQGRPQAQAAKQNGYNGGKDQFGRVVKNPAGIDLADGMFWDGLKLTTNAWVTVSFQWTGAGPTAAAPALANVRNAPAPDAPIVGLAARAAHLHLECQQDTWYRLAPTMWISAADVTSVVGVPGCVTPG
jgi:hypothetical protein